MENRQHIQVSSEILKNKNLSNNDIGVYLAIGKYMNKDTKEAFPSQATLVKDTNLALQTVRSCIRKLKAAKAFEIENEVGIIFTNSQKMKLLKCLIMSS